MYDVDLQAAWRTYLEILFRDHGQNDFVGQPHLAFDRGQQLAHQLRPPVTGDNQTDLHAPKTLLTSKTASREKYFVLTASPSVVRSGSDYSTSNATQLPPA